MSRITRRAFLKGTSFGLLLPSMAGQLGFSLGSARAALKGMGGQKTLVYLFFRGGMDTLSWLVPISGQNRVEYENKRPNIRVPLTGNDAAVPLDNEFGLNAGASALTNLYNMGSAAFVQACGMPSGTGSRSHFESMRLYETGTIGGNSQITGWLARYLDTSPSLSPSAIFPSLTPGVLPDVLKGSTKSVAVDDPSNFHPNSGRYGSEHLSALNAIYNGSSSMDETVRTAVDTVNQLENSDLSVPDSYPNTSLAQDLGLIAQVIKGNYGLEVATVDYGGWDTHENQGNNGAGYFRDRIRTVSEAIDAFFADLAASGHMDDVVLVTQTDFGRRVRENGNRGTDHGTGQVMLVAGGAVQGGRILGTFPGIADEQLYLNTDVAATTDYRTVLSDIIVNFMGNPAYKTVFPGYNGRDGLGLFPTERIFVDEFESL